MYLRWLNQQLRSEEFLTDDIIIKDFLHRLMYSIYGPTSRITFLELLIDSDKSHLKCIYRVSTDLIEHPPGSVDLIYELWLEFPEISAPV